MVHWIGQAVNMNASMMIGCYSTILEMMADRGVEVTHTPGLAELRVAFQSGTGSVVASSNACFMVLLSDSLCVAFYRTSKIRVSDIEGCLATLRVRAHGDRARMLVVLSEPVNQIVSRQMSSAFRDIDFEMWSASELRVNFSRHVLVPRHELLVDDAEVLAKYQLKSSMLLPLISSSDMMSRYLNAKPGHLMRITRNSPSAGVYVVYRRVV